MAHRDGVSYARVNGEAGAEGIALEYGPSRWKGYSNEKLDAEVELYRYRTYVPLRFYSERLGLEVDWVGETGTMVLTTRG